MYRILERATFHVTEKYVYVADPATKGLFIISKSAFEKAWIGKNKNREGVLLLLETTPEFNDKANYYVPRTASASS